MHFFYQEGEPSDSIILEGEEAHHLIVLRLNVHEKVSVVNGRGMLQTGVIQSIQKKQVVIKIDSIRNIDPPEPILHIALAPTKSIDRYEWFLEKATELGVQVFTPIITQTSERRHINTERLNKIIVSAMKQSGRAWLPKLNEPVPFIDFLKSSNDTEKWIAHISGTSLNTVFAPGLKSVTACIGPEGDFTDHEIELAVQAGYEKVNLGEYRLRTETAGLYLACSVDFSPRIGL